MFRSERLSAVLLLCTAALGVLLANTGWGPALQSVRDAPLDVPWLGLRLSAGHWVTDGLLAVFFFLAAIELRHELRHGELTTVGKALAPAIAAVGGVVAPAIVFLAIAHQPGLSMGWPIPTATDVAFALGAIALVGRRLPPRVRAFLLALAVIDDLIAIVIIAFFLTQRLQLLPLLIAVPVVASFWWLSRRRPSAPVATALVLLGVAAWVLVALSGVHPTIAGVALGLTMHDRSAAKTRHALEPVSNGVILPLFAFVAALVTLPAVGIGHLSPAFWAIVVALPVGKLVGITAGALASRPLSPRPARMPIGDILTVASLGGIGFTVSLLMNELSYAHDPLVRTEGTLAVLVASVLAAAIGMGVTATRSRHYSRLRRSAR